MNQSELNHYRKKYAEMKRKGKKCPDCAARAERIKKKIKDAGKTITKR